MTQTSNYNLNKFQSTDKMNPTTLNGLNDNADKIDTALAGLNTNKQNKLTAGSNISISGNTISATDTTYTAGTNVSIDNNVISATDTTYNDATTTVAGLMSATDKTKLDDTFKELTSPVRIWGLAGGIYKLPANCDIYYNGATGTAKLKTTSVGYLFVMANLQGSVNYVSVFGWYGYGTNGMYMAGGSSASTGTIKAQSMNNVLTSISSLVKDNLTYNTAGTAYALSAYQGYVLNQNKQEKMAEPLTADLNLINGTVPTGLVSGNYYFVGSHHVKINGTTFDAFDNMIFYYQVEHYEDVEAGIDEYYYNLYTTILTGGLKVATIGGYTDNNLNPLTWTSDQNYILLNSSITTSKPSDPSRPTYNSYVPSTKLFYTEIGNVESVLQTLNSGNGVS